TLRRAPSRCRNGRRSRKPASARARLTCLTVERCAGLESQRTRHGVGHLVALVREEVGAFDVDRVALVAFGPAVPRPRRYRARLAVRCDARAQVPLELSDLLFAADGA